MDYLQWIYSKLIGEDGVNTPRKFVAFGNVLLDHTIRLTDETSDLLDRYELNLDTRAELDAKIISKLIEDASSRSECVYGPGGSALNTVRMMKNLGTDALFFGAVGDDNVADKLKKSLEENGIETRLETVKDLPTGQCVCLVYKDSIGLYANVGASTKFSLNHLQNEEMDEQRNFLRPTERKQIIYIEGFFVTHRHDICKFIMGNYIKERRRLAVNLSAPYIVENYYEIMNELAKAAYFVFGNSEEYETLVRMSDCENIETMTRKLMEQSTEPKVFIITKGADGVQIITNYVDEQEPPGPIRFESYNTNRVDEVIDTTGAGDAFVAAFLHGWLQKRSLSECIRLGTEISSQVVTQIGCNLPSEV